MGALDEWNEGGADLEEAQRFTSLGRTVLIEAMDSGRLVWSKVGARRIVSRRSLKRLLAEGTQEASA